MLDYKWLLKLLVKAEDYPWTLQGFGMFRLYLSRKVRLHVWNDKYRISAVSDIHTHPWSFTSEVLAGEIQNTRYAFTQTAIENSHVKQTIVCGMGGGKAELTNATREVLLWKTGVERYLPGAAYEQSPIEVHSTHAKPGTITLVTRVFQPDTELADVFFPIGTEWVSAEPRNATIDEIKSMKSDAIRELIHTAPLDRVMR